MTYLSADIPGTGGVFKQVPEDFLVDEAPLEEFTGRGRFVLLRIRKRAMTTHEAVSRLARRLKLRDAEVGFAGIKDARAVTTQWVSIPGGAASRLEGDPVAGVEVLETTRHPQALRPGRLSGNHFEVLLRDVAPGSIEHARASLEILQRRGVPNFFGAQRFGTKGDSDLIGKALLSEDFDEALRLYLGAPSELERDGRIRHARTLFEEGRHEEALRAFPRWLRNERKVLGHYLKTFNPAAAMARIPKSLRLLFLSAYQSRLFNECLERRLDQIDRALEGDVLVDHASGEVRLDGELDASQREVDALRSSPTGPLFGPGLIRAHGAPGDMEEEVFREAGIDPEEQESPFRDTHLKGERRAYRIPLNDVVVDSTKRGLRLRFFLPRGAYATTVLGEVMKVET